MKEHQGLRLYKPLRPRDASKNQQAQPLIANKNATHGIFKT